MSFIISIIVFLIALSLIVLIHEFGHFITAKKFGVRVLEFGLGFPPRVFSKKIGETIYSINAIPLGGFVRLLGEDEADRELLETEKEKKEWQKYSFSSKAPWQRVIIASAGVIMNLILAWIILTGILMSQGFQYRIPLYLPYHFVGVKQTNKDAVIVSQVTNSTLTSSIKTGDQILSVDGTALDNYSEFSAILEKTAGKKVTLVTSNLSDQGMQAQPKDAKSIILTPLKNPAIEILDVSKSSPAQIAGLQTGNLIIAVNNQPITDLKAFSSEVQKSGGMPVIFSVQDPKNNNSTKEITITPRANPPAGQGALGISISETFIPGVDLEELPLAYLTYQTPLQKTFSGLLQGYNEMGYNLALLSRLISTSIATKSIGPASEAFHGIVAIGYYSNVILHSASPAFNYLDLVAEISLSLALFNILPLPALDGGRIFFVLIAMITRKKVNPNIERKIHTVGFIFLIGLTILIAFNDINQFIVPKIMSLFPH